MAHIYTIEEAKKILQVDEDFDDDLVELYLDTAEGQLEAQTGYDFTEEPNADAKLYVKMSILMQHYNQDGFNKEYDYVFGMHAAVTRLSMVARRKLRQDG